MQIDINDYWAFKSGCDRSVINLLPKKAIILNLETMSLANSETRIEYEINEEIDYMDVASPLQEVKEILGLDKEKEQEKLERQEFEKKLTLIQKELEGLFFSFPFCDHFINKINFICENTEANWFDIVRIVNKFMLLIQDLTKAKS